MTRGLFPPKLAERLGRSPNLSTQPELLERACDQGANAVLELVAEDRRERAQARGAHVGMQ
eukprot:8959624-Alexandrium_andersonii.AAC.1